MGDFSLDKTLIFVDGENLTLRYEEMLRQGHIPREDNVYIPGAFIWNQNIFETSYWNIKRLSYYTSVTGDDDRVREVRKQISETTFACYSNEERTEQQSGQIVPFVRKKASRARKESICDIAIAVDVMRACYRDHAETIWVFSGDGDFVQLVEEAVHSGKRVYQSAFSSGLNEELRYVVDEFIDLDYYFFFSEEELQEEKESAEAAKVAKKERARLKKQSTVDVAAASSD